MAIVRWFSVTVGVLFFHTLTSFTFTLTTHTQTHKQVQTFCVLCSIFVSQFSANRMHTSVQTCPWKGQSLWECEQVNCHDYHSHFIMKSWATNRFQIFMIHRSMGRQFDDENQVKSIWIIYSNQYTNRNTSPKHKYYSHFAFAFHSRYKMCGIIVLCVVFFFLSGSVHSATRMEFRVRFGRFSYSNLSFKSIYSYQLATTRLSSFQRFSI